MDGRDEGDAEDAARASPELREAVRRPGVVATICAALLALALAGGELRRLDRYLEESERLPLWDMAANGRQGFELASDVARGDAMGFLLDVNRQEKMPFGHSLLQLPFFLVEGGAFRVACRPAEIAFLLIPVLLVLLAREIDPGWTGAASGLAAGAMFVAAPLPRLFAILDMRELPGAALAILLLALFLRAERTGSDGAHRLAGFALLALFLEKWNFGVLLLASLLALRFVRVGPEGRRELVRKLRVLLLPYRREERTAGRIAVALFCDATLLAGAVRVDIGPAAIAGLLWLAVRLLLEWRRNPAELAGRWRKLDGASRAFLSTVALPLGVWFLVPVPFHARAFFHYLRNRSHGPPLFSVDSLLFYVRSFLLDDSAWPSAGGAALALAAVALVLRGERAERARPVSLTVAVVFLLATFHANKEPRFLLIAVPLVWLVAALALPLVVEKLLNTRTALAAAALLAIGAVTFAAGTIRAAEGLGRVGREHAAATGEPALRAVLDALVRDVPPVRRLALVGDFNELSRHLVVWTLLARPGSHRLSIASTIERSRADGSDPLGPGVAAWIADERADVVVAIGVDPSSRFAAGADFRERNAWRQPAARLLIAEPESCGVRLIRRIRFPELGLDVGIGLPVAAPPASGE